MKRSNLVGIALALVAGALVLALWPREPSDPKVLIERKVVQMVRAAEEKNLAALMDGVSERFRSAEGWNRDEVRSILAAQILRGSWVRVFMTDLEISVTSPTTASVSAKFVFGRSEAEKLEDLARESVFSAYLIEAAVEKEADGEWRIVSAKHRALEPSSLF